MVFSVSYYSLNSKSIEYAASASVDTRPGTTERIFVPKNSVNRVNGRTQVPDKFGNRVFVRFALYIREGLVMAFTGLNFSISIFGVIKKLGKC
jgi:hypothetical protein